VSQRINANLLLEVAAATANNKQEEDISSHPKVEDTSNNPKAEDTSSHNNKVEVTVVNSKAATRDTVEPRRSISSPKRRRLTGTTSTTIVNMSLKLEEALLPDLVFLVLVS